MSLSILYIFSKIIFFADKNVHTAANGKTQNSIDRGKLHNKSCFRSFLTVYEYVCAFSVRGWGLPITEKYVCMTAEYSKTLMYCQPNSTVHKKLEPVVYS